MGGLPSMCTHWYTNTHHGIIESFLCIPLFLQNQGLALFPLNKSSFRTYSPPHRPPQNIALSPMSSCYLLCLIHWKWGLLSIGTNSVSSEHITSQITAFVNHSHSICSPALTSLLLDWFLGRTCDSFAPNPTVVFHTSMPSSLSIASLPPHLPMLSLGNGILIHTWSWTLWHPNHNCKFFSVHGTLFYSRATVLVEGWNFIQMLIS